jgi:hypothetical protein
MRARVHSQQRGQRWVMRWPARARKERATARAAAGSTGEKKRKRLHDVGIAENQEVGFRSSGGGKV